MAIRSPILVLEKVFNFLLLIGILKSLRVNEDEYESVRLYFFRLEVELICMRMCYLYRHYPNERFLATRITVRSETLVSFAVSLILSLLITRS